MRFLILGRGKTGSLVAEVATRRKHHVRVLGSADKPHAAALTPSALQDFNLVINFSTPIAVMANIVACVGYGTNMVVRTTGWYEEIAKVKALVKQNFSGFLLGPNFSIGVNLFFEIGRAAASALQQGYVGQIFERHRAGKKDAPSGTALKIQNIL